MAALTTTTPPPALPRLTQQALGTVMLVLAVTCGAAVANIYYAQPLLGPIAHTLHVSHGTASLLVTATQVGYAVGLAFLLPAGDLVENRRLATILLLTTAVGLVAVCVAPNFGVLAAALVVVGLTSIVAQVLIPIAAHLAPPAERGAWVGLVTSGLLAGIMLARSVASFVSAAWDWRAIYGISAALMVLVTIALRRYLPRITPSHGASYGSLLRSTLTIARAEPVLVRRALAQALMFGTFTAFWTAIGYELSGHHGFGQTGIALFAFVGAAGALSAPVAGRLGDAGHGAQTRLAGFVLALVAMVLAATGAHSVLLLAVAAVVLDLAAQANHVLSMRDIYALRPEARARINSVYMTTMFLGGAASSAAAGAISDAWGWSGVGWFGAVLATIGAGFWLSVRGA